MGRNSFRPKRLAKKGILLYRLHSLFTGIEVA